VHIHSYRPNMKSSASRFARAPMETGRLSCPESGPGFPVRVTGVTALMIRGVVDIGLQFPTKTSSLIEPYAPSPCATVPGWSDAHFGIGPEAARAICPFDRRRQRPPGTPDMPRPIDSPSPGGGDDRAAPRIPFNEHRDLRRAPCAGLSMRQSRGAPLAVYAAPTPAFHGATLSRSSGCRRGITAIELMPGTMRSSDDPHLLDKGLPQLTGAPTRWAFRPGDSAYSADRTDQPNFKTMLKVAARPVSGGGGTTKV